MPRAVSASLAALVVGAALLTGCGGTADAGTGDNKSNVATGQEGFDDVRELAAQLGTDAAPGEFPRTVRNLVANEEVGETEIPAKPERVIVLDTGELDNMVSLGIEPVGIAHPADAEMAPDYLDVGDAVDLGAYDALDLEQIKNLEPDLILGTSLRIDDDGLKAKLQDIAPTVLSPRPGVLWKENFLLNAAAVGEEDRAQELLDAYEERAGEVGAEVVEANGGAAPTVSMLRFMAGQIRLYANDSFVGIILADAGLPRPETEDIADLAVEISAEEITLAEGDWLLWGTYGQPDATEQAAVVDGPLWDQVPAVADGGVVREVPDDTWYLGLGVTGAELVLDDLETIAADQR
ncbi:iron-siderophore ABC transporter substrate-binding protein [Promicromonospora sukumoe]|uniref:Iron complex transport system substrate-binding protein n=1 Tax=Promicromonospora sukumoe TaxID=88382 RepID=A0A7W3PCE8_9MICO|nr:iron-siderophore ABC transporter substrate-binding protein [Promicromonospora sukumoe]MBA8806820.1 iron complex transport system substrate-binding protein [Promicromonospora sukumoe]